MCVQHAQRPDVDGRTLIDVPPVCVERAGRLHKACVDACPLLTNYHLQEKEKLYVELKGILARQPGPEVAEQLSIYQVRVCVVFVWGGHKQASHSTAVFVHAVAGCVTETNTDGRVAVTTCHASLLHTHRPACVRRQSSSRRWRRSSTCTGHR